MEVQKCPTDDNFMAMFQQYQNGVRPVTGMAEAGANIGNMYAQGISNMAKGLNEGIKAYNENSAKNDLANQKIQTLGQDIANKIAMYSQDPEISQSGVLEGLHQAASTLQDAPTKGLNQRLAIAHEAETRLAGFGQQLQEWSFLRGRAIERGIAEGLQQYSGTVTSTKAVNLDDPNFAVRANESLVDQKKRVMDFYGNIKKVNPKVQFDDNEFWSRWLSKAEQETSKAQGIDPSIISAQLEAIQGEKNIVGQNKVASERLPEGAFQQGGMMYQPKTEGGYDYEGTPMQNTVKDYEATMQTPAEAPERKRKQAEQDTAEAMGYLTKPPVNTAQIKIWNDEIKLLDEKIAGLSEGNKRKTGFTLGAANAIAKGAKNTAGWYATRQARNATEDWFREANIDTSKMSDAELVSFMRKQFRENTSAPMAFLTELSHPASLSNPFQVVAYESGAAIKGKRSATFTDREEQAFNVVAKGVDANWSANDSSISSLEQRKQELKDSIDREGKSKFLIKQEAKQSQVAPKVPDIGLGDMIVGSRTDTRPISVSERKSQVQDFLTQRFGAIDPTDPSGKRRVPVQGFEEYFKKAVPESDIKEYTTESGIRLIQMNGKWEQMKMPEARTLQDIRKESVGIYGKQASNGELIPTEFIPNSGVMVGGMFRGTDAANDKYTEEMTGLIDSRRSIRRLQEINDKTGEWASFKLSGEAIVEVTNLKAALRTDIIGVGTVSNFEQELIDRVIKDPTTFFSMESKDRAILLALASRVDRRIQNISAAKGLTVQIRDTNNQNSRFDDLRQRYLREKGLL